MTVRILFFLVSLSLVVRLDAAMVRVAGVVDGQTLVVERGGARVQVKLAGVALTDESRARALLQWTVVSSWVMLEEQADGSVFVYRSPDAMFVNRELVVRGFASATLPGIEPPSHVIVTYLGTLHPVPARTAVDAKPARTRSASGNGSGTSDPARSRPSRRSRRRD